MTSASSYSITVASFSGSVLQQALNAILSRLGVTTNGPDSGGSPTRKAFGMVSPFDCL